MNVVTILFSFSVVGTTLGFSELSLNGHFVTPLRENIHVAINDSRRYALSSTCSVETGWESEEIVEVDEENDINTALKKQGFFKHSCHPDPRVGQEEEEEEAFCIYSNPTINLGSGMSVISKPSILSETLEHILDLSQDPVSTDTFDVVSMPEKGGVGVLAAHRLTKGSLVVNSQAVFLASVEESTFERSDWPRIRKLAIDLLPKKTRERVNKLYGKGQNEEEILSNAIDMNSFDISLGINENIPFFALFLKPSQLNHDCRPNTAFYVDTETLQVHVHALRTINPGEEMTLSYRDMVQTREERQQELSEYGFKCTCEHCSMNSEQVEESDQRIRRIQQLTDSLNEWNQVASLDMMEQADELIELYLLEKLDNNIPDGYTLASLTHNSFGNTSKARWYAAQAIQTGLINGPKWEELDSLTQIVKAPRHHWSYRSRISSTLS